MRKGDRDKIRDERGEKGGERRYTRKKKAKHSRAQILHKTTSTSLYCSDSDHIRYSMFYTHDSKF